MQKLNEIRRTLTSVISLCVCLASGSTAAATITLDPVASGYVSHASGFTVFDGPFENYFREPSLNVLYQSYSSATNIAASLTDTLGFLVYDFSAFSYQIDQASLSLDLRYTDSAGRELTARPFGGVNSQQIFDNAVSAESQYQILENASDAGMLSINGPIDGLFDLNLTPSVLNSIRASGNLIAIGLSFNADAFAGSSPDILFIDSTPQLSLSGSTAIPSPATAPLVLLPLLIMLRRARRVPAASVPLRTSVDGETFSA